MDGNLSSNLFKNLNCLGCNSSFCIKGFASKGPKCPWLLKCGHSLCDSCIKQNHKTSNSITCPQCRASHSLDSKAVSEQFSFDLYLMGTLTMLQFEKQEKDKKKAMFMMGDANFNYSVRGKQSDSCPNNKLLCEECLTVAHWSCENCQCHFCDLCWLKVHGAAKSLIKHIKLPVTVIQNKKTEFQKCPLHELQNLDLFCKSCGKGVCSHCVIESHQGAHSLVTMKEQNLEMVNQLKTVAEEAEVICKRMKHTLEKIEFIQDSPDIPDNQLYSSLRNQIMRNFAHLHGILQLQEEKILKKIYDKFNERENTLKNLSTQLGTQIQKTEFLLEKFEEFVQKPDVCDLNVLYDQLSEVKTLPCYLISQKSDLGEVKVTFNETVLDLFDNYCTLELPSNEVFELRSSTDLPEDFAVEPLPLTNCDQRNASNTFGSNSDLETVSDCSSREYYDSTEIRKLNSPGKGNVFCEGQKYSVHITYIHNPGEFYVTLNSQRKVKENIEKRAASYNYPFIIPSKISKDDLYLVRYKVDRKWYRGRIVEVLPEKDGETRAVVHYIDYGNTDSVSVSWVKPLPPDLTEEPPLAIKCKLFNCVPRNGKWSLESVKTMEKIVRGLTATLFVMKIHPDCLEVDLSVIYPDGQIGRDIVSVRDALIFLECASFVGGPKIQENPPAVKYEEQFTPSAGECFDVVITHVNSPDDFYLHRTKYDGLYLCKLGVELQKYYDENSHKGVIYNPKVGMPCAAKFSADKKWYRAIIDDLPGNKMVTVFYVDYGNKEKLPWLDIRKLRENFVKRPPLALNCSLSNTEPRIPGNWDSQAKDFLEKCTLTKGIWIRVDAKQESQEKLQVFMYKQIDKREICVNSLFEDMGFTAATVSEDESESKNFSNDFGDTLNEEKQQRKKHENLNRERTARKSKLSAKELRENYEIEKRQFEEATATEDSCNSETAEFEDNIFRVKVEVLSAESPASVYVTFSEADEDFKKLQSELNDFYANATPSEDKEWVVDSKCAVYNSEKNCWCRATVSKINRDGFVNVLLRDFAVTITVSTSLLRELDPLFMKLGPRAIKCHLADVMPPGDTWPGISCEFLAGELEGYTEVYMTRKGQIENNSLPVELWVQKLIPASALEPSNVEWVTLNKLLVDKGLAVPKQNLWYLQVMSEKSAISSKKETESTMAKEEEVETSEKCTNEPTIFLPSLSSHWLPPEPIKKTQFTGLATYVDHDGHIYIQDEEDQKTLLEIRDSLKEEYEDSKPNAEDHFWSEGQMCVARYFADKNWYRGVVLEVNEMGHYQVLFVDYGNIETCQVAELRKKVKMTAVPILVNKFKLYGVTPVSQSGKWPLPVIEVLHSLVVDEKCKVNILKQPVDVKKPYLATLNILDSNVDVASVLIQEDLGVQQFIDCKSLESFDQNCSFEKETTHCIPQVSDPVGYVSLNIPKDCKGLNVLVKALRNENGFYGHIIEDENLPLNLRTTLNDFKKLEETLAEECHLQPKLENIVEGSPCCCVHSGINKWCRGQIETVTDNCVCIFYVDYGYKEFLTMDLVHECKTLWLQLPKMAVIFHIPGLEKCPNMSKAAYMKALTSCLMETECWAEILTRHKDYLEVELLTKKYGVLSYKQLMDSQLVKMTP